MALTKSDLHQIKGVVHEEVENVVDEKLEPVKKSLKDLQRSFKRMNKTVNIIAKNYDEEDVKLHKRVNKIEKHLNLS